MELLKKGENAHKNIKTTVYKKRLTDRRNRYVLPETTIFAAFFRYAFKALAVFQFRFCFLFPLPKVFLCFCGVKNNQFFNIFIAQKIRTMAIG